MDYAKSPTCIQSDNQTFNVVIDPSITGANICNRDSGQFNIIGGGRTSKWSPIAGLSNSDIPNPKVLVEKDTSYTVEIWANDNSYFGRYKVPVKVNKSTVYNFETEVWTDYDNASVEFNGLTKVRNQTWDVGMGKFFSDSQFMVQYNKEDTYSIIIAGIDTNGCSFRTEKPLEVEFMLIPNVFTPNGDGINEKFEISGLKEGTVSMEIFNRWGTKVFESGQDKYQNDWKADNQADGMYFYNFKLNYRPEKLYKGWVQVIR